MFIQRLFRRHIPRDCFYIQRHFSASGLHDLALSTPKESSNISTKIEDNIVQKVNSKQFKSLKEDIFNSQDSDKYHNTEILRTIILKSIRKKNSAFAYDILESMVKIDVIPDDATYTCLIDALLHEGRIQDSFGLYIQAYLNNIVLDLQIFHSLILRLQKKDISYVEVAYEILKQGLVPSKPLFDSLIHISQKAKASGFLKVIHEDMNKYGINKGDNANVSDKLESYSPKEKRGSKSMANKSMSPLMVVPFNPSDRDRQGSDMDYIGFKNLVNGFMQSLNPRDSKFAAHYDESYEEDSEQDSEEEDDSEETDSDTSDSDNTPRRNR